MATSPLTRNLRDGQMVVKDGSGTPKTVTLTLDEGDLNWNEPLETVEVKDRGTLDHTRPGDEMSGDISFSLKWNQLISFTVTSGDGNTFYEMINNVGSAYTSTSSTGQRFTLLMEFTVTSPSGSGSEKIAFSKVYKKDLNMAEGADYNTISFSGTNFATRPTVTRV
jgi:hypothetical protein